MATGWGTGAVEAASALGIPSMPLRMAQRDRLRAHTEREAQMAPLEEEYTRARIADLLAKPEERALMRSFQLAQLTLQERQNIAQRNRWRDQAVSDERRHKERMAAEEGRWRRHMETMTKPATGYMKDPDNPKEQIPIPGGKVDVAEIKAYETDKGKAQGVVDTLNFTREKALALLNHKGLEGITGIAGKFPDIPKIEDFHEGEAFDAQALFDTLKTQIFTSALQKMRHDSPTGGALGNVSNLEGDKLERIMGAMKRGISREQFEKELRRFIKQLDYSAKKIQGDFARTYEPVIRRVEKRKHPGRGGPSAPSGPSTPQGLQPGHEEDGYRFKGGDPSKPENWEKI